MATFDNIERTRTSRFGGDWIAFFNGKYDGQQAVSLVSRLCVHFVDYSSSQMVLDLQGGGRLWRMFAGFEMLEIETDGRLWRFNISQEANLNNHR